MDMDLRVKERVNAGVQLLDEHCPGWHEHINPDILCIWSIKFCVLGQIFGSYGRGVSRLQLMRPQSYGFHIIQNEHSPGDDVRDELKQLERAWKRHIRQKQALASA